MNSTDPIRLSNLIQCANLLTLVVGLIVVSSMLGRKGQQLDDTIAEVSELRQITRDLADTSIRGEVTDASHLAMLHSLSARLGRLENR